MNGWDTFEENDWRYYQTDKLAVVPYMIGTPVYADGVLPDLYKRTKDEGKIEEVFCGDVLNMDAFVNFSSSRAHSKNAAPIPPSLSANAV